MPTTTILKAASVITMNPAQPRAEAIAVDAGSGEIAAVGSLADCRTAAPDAPVEDLGTGVLMPGLIQAHDHPVPAAVLCEKPAHWIAPFVGFPNWADVEALFARLRRDTPAGRPLLFNGLDRLLLSIPMPDRTSLDTYFPDHPVLIFDMLGAFLPGVVPSPWCCSTPTRTASTRCGCRTPWPRWAPGSVAAASTWRRSWPRSPRWRTATTAR